MSDLAVVAADKSIAEALRGIMSRPQSIGMREIAATIVEHPNRDPGVLKSGHDLLGIYADDHDHGLVVLDHAWDGNPYKKPSLLAQEIESRCESKWSDRARCIVIDPELEVWVWSKSPHVAKALMWESNDALFNWLTSSGLLGEGESKPDDPKMAVEKALREKRVPPSAARFRRLAENVSFDSCRDDSFNRLLNVLRKWFPEPC